MAPKVFVIVLNWNKWEFTIECLESITRLDYENFQILVVDNGSTDGSESRIMEWANGDLPSKGSFVPYGRDNKPIAVVRYDRGQAEQGGDPAEEARATARLSQKQTHPMVLIQSGADLGYAGGNNVALRYALARGDFDYIWVLNNDIAVHRDALSAMVQTSQNHEDAGIVGSKLLYYDVPEKIQAAGGGTFTAFAGNTSYIGSGCEDKGDWDREMEVDYVTGASMLVPKSALMRTGLIIEDYFLCWEDVHWNLQMKRNGYRLLYSPGSVIWHKEGGTVGQVSPAMDYYWTRNGLKPNEPRVCFCRCT
jgi:GT2 family glycosyltransferase